MANARKIWQCRNRREDVGRKTYVMGILNVTPDSFSDGGKNFTPGDAVTNGMEMERAGVDIIDVGGESTRPGAEPVGVDEEISRTEPVIRELALKTGCLISIDTMKAETARAALDAGAHIVNDVSAGCYSQDMPQLVREYGAGIVLMHMLGSPKTMQRRPEYKDLLSEVCGHLRKRMDLFVAAGCDPKQVVLDPGIGFGKSVEHNLELLRNIERVQELERPVLIGASRKSFLGKLLDIETSEREAASLGVAAYSIMRGANIVRVHDVKASCHLAKIIDILQRG